MQYVLASASPRRKQLLSELITDFEVIPSLADESKQKADSPKALVAELAKLKASEVAFRPENEGKIVIGSDTVVAFEENVLGKPVDEADAFRMLKLLSGNKHTVYTGVCVIRVKGGKAQTIVDVDGTDVYFEELSDEWIRSYILSGSPMDKAGAYGIQDGGLVKRIEGSYTNVVGFPVKLFEKILERVEKEWR